MIGKVTNVELILIDFEKNLEGFWMTFGINFRALYPMGFQVRSESDFGAISAPKGFPNRLVFFAGSVLEALLVPLGSQDGFQRP